MKFDQKIILPKNKIKDLAQYLTDHLDDKELEKLDFENLELLTADFCNEIGNEILQSLVNKKSKKESPKNIKIVKDKKKKL